MTQEDTTIGHQSTGVPRGRINRRTVTAGLAGIALLAIGAGAGATGWSLMQKGPQTFDHALPATQIGALAEADRVELQGKVVEIYGNKFVVDDGTGRALVETGRAGEGGKLVAANETVTVQGRFDDGFLKASALQRADGSIDELRPAPPRHPPRDRP